MSNDLLPKEVLAASVKQARGSKQREKLDLFLKATRSKNILRSCRDHGRPTSFYYYWWNRYRDSGFKLEALEEKSRRPKRVPRRTDPKVVEAIKGYREKFHFGPEKIRLYLEQEHGLRVSKSTVYRVLLKTEHHRPSGSPQNQEQLIESLTEHIDALLERSKHPGRKSIHSMIQKAVLEWRKPAKSRREGARGVEILDGRYRLEKELGRGGTGIVYRALDLNSRSNRVALKRIPLERRLEPAMIASLKNEFSALTLLQHPHLAKVFDFGMTEKELYFTSEFIAGQDILASTYKADLNTSFQLIIQVLQALDFLHRRGVLHLDLKAANILVTDPDKTGEMVVKLIDFGTAAWRKKTQLASGEFAGTPPYTAPEIIQEKRPDSTSDLYSLGMILHQILARRLPFETKDPFKMMKEQVYGQPLRLAQVHPALPQDFSDLLLRMISKNPSDRFQTPREVLGAINHCLGERYSLRPASSPSQFLEESDFMFRGELHESLISGVQEGTPRLTVLSGAAGMGKTRLLQQVKWGLQLRGVQPVFLETVSAVEKFLEEGAVLEPPLQSPLLIDRMEESYPDWVTLLGRLENLRVPVLLATRKERSLQLNPTHWIELKPVDSETLSAFLQTEIPSFPKSEHQELSSPGVPAHLEALLEALREEGRLQWSDAGWTWAGSAEVDWSRLLPDQERRWDGRLLQIQKILEASQIGMNAKTLGGILALDPGILEPRLEHWADSGVLLRRKIKRLNHYYPKPESPREKPGVIPDNWEWLEKELAAQYESGDFQSGSRLADLVIFREKSKMDLPNSVLLLGARHHAAAGEAKKALQIIALLPPEEARASGLAHEISARALWSLRKLSEMPGELDAARKIYGASRDRSGLSRISNLWGSYYKSLGDGAAAEQAFQEAAQEAAEVGDHYLQGLAQMNLATLYHDQGQFAQAEKVYQQAFQSESKAEHPLLACKLRHNWVNLNFHLGRAMEAEERCYEWLRISLQHRYVDQQAAALNYLALLAGKKNHQEMQLNYLNQAAGILNPAQFPQLYCQTLINRGQVHCDLRSWTAAQLDAEAALNLAERRLDTSLSGLGALLLGKVLRDRPLPDLESASFWFNTAQERIWKHQIRQLYWEVEFERGRLAKKKKEIEKARNYFLSARQELESYIKELPESSRLSFLRDQKVGRLATEVASLEAEKSH